MSDRPLFEIGPGALLWGTTMLTTGAPVPPPLLAQATDEGGTWKIPGFEHCTRPVVKVSLVGAGDDGAALVQAEQRVELLRAKLATSEAEANAAKADLATLQARLDVVEDELGQAREALASAKRKKAPAKRTPKPKRGEG